MIRFSCVSPYTLAMRIALAQINPTVGDLAGNVRKIIDFIARAKTAGADLVVFPELAVTGYPPKDLLLKPQFIADNLRALDLIASRVTGIEVIVGYVEPNRQPVGRRLHNAVALLRDGAIAGRKFKKLLPTYDVFDESRYFEPGPRDDRSNVVPIAGRQVGLSICEDLWNDERMVAHQLYHVNPIADLHAAGADVMVNASASPFVVGKHEFRLALFGSQARQFHTPLVYVNQVGGNDELVFDGNSVVLDAEGNVLAQAKDFEEDLLVVDLPQNHRGGSANAISVGSALADASSESTPTQERVRQGGPYGTPPSPRPGEREQHSHRAIESIYKALVLGLHAVSYT